MIRGETESVDDGETAGSSGGVREEGEGLYFKQTDENTGQKSNEEAAD